jgi:hypothetical protein
MVRRAAVSFVGPYEATDIKQVVVAGCKFKRIGTCS